MTTPATDTTTPDTALAVIERHLSEWGKEHEKAYRERRSVDIFGGATTALMRLRDELRSDTPTPDAWNADRDAFDPVRAGLRDAGHSAWTGADGDNVCDIDYLMSDNVWRVGITYEPPYAARAFELPADLPHNVVISILRANGWGGDDESV